jgi:glucokinase
MNAIIGIDVGATTIAAGLVTHAGDVLYTVQQPTHQDGPGTAVKTLLALVEELTAEAARTGLVLDGVGVGLAGVIDPLTGAMLTPPGNGVPEFGQVRLTDEIHRLTGLPAYVENDANALALGESTFGVGRGAHSLVLFAIGTDVGGGIVLDGQIVRGAHGSAGEFHFLCANIDGEVCYCGARGCLAAYVGGRGIAMRAHRRLAGGARSSLPALAGGDPSAVTSVHVFQAAAAGDGLARELVDGACAALGAAIAAASSFFDPEVVVIAGGVARSLVPLADDLRRRAAASALPSAIARTRIHVIGSDKRVTVRGGAALVVATRRGRALAARA